MLGIEGFYMPEDEQQPGTLNQALAGVGPQDEVAAPGGDLPPAPEVAPVEQGPEEPYGWQASEFVHHQKTIVWYVVVGVGVLVLSMIAAALHLWLEIGVFIVMGIAIMVYGSKPPRTLSYELNDKGVHVDEKVYAYEEFRSFGVVHDDAWHSIDLEPTKRLSPRLVLLFGDDDLDAILAHLERHLPREDRQPDLIERITRYVRF
jgi:hypothetical protein